MKRFVFFCFAGGSGFLVDAGLLSLLLHTTALGPFVARILAIAAAMAVTWLINRHLTFDRSGRSIRAEGFRYVMVATITATFNYGLYSMLLVSVPILRPLAAMVFATAATMLLSFFGYCRYVFAPRRSAP